MAKITFKIVSSNFVGAIVQVDGEVLKFKKSKDKHDGPNTMIAQVEVAKREVPLHIANWYELERGGWFFYAAFFWFIGLFGLIAPKYERRCHKLSYYTQLSLLEGKDDSFVQIKFLSPYKQGYAMEMSSNFTTTLNNESNRYDRCYLAEKRAKAVRVLGFFASVAAIIGIVTYVMNIIS